MDNKIMVVHDWERYAIGDLEEIRQLRVELKDRDWLNDDNAIVINTKENFLLFWNRYDLVFQDDFLKENIF